MQTIFAATACLPEGWVQDVRLTVEGGSITRIESAAIAAREGRPYGRAAP